MDEEMVIKDLADLDLDTLEAGIINRLACHLTERAFVVHVLTPSEFSNSEASRTYAAIIGLPFSVEQCACHKIEALLGQRADSGALEYLSRAEKFGMPASLKDLMACALIVHDRSVICRYNDEDGVRATQAWVDSIEASIAYNPEEFEDRPDDE